MTEQVAKRYSFYQRLVENPHRDFDNLYLDFVELRDEDPYYFSRMVAYINKNSRIRDLIRAALAVSAKSNDWEFQTEHRDLAAAIIRDLNARELWFVLSLIRNNEFSDRNQRYAKIPRTIVTEVKKWWQDKIDAGVWDRVALANKKYVVAILIWCHIRSPEYINNTLFGNERHGVFSVLTELENSEDVYDRARIIMENNVPEVVASTFLPMSAPETWVAIVDVATPQQLANRWNSLKDAGAWENPELYRRARQKIESGKKDKRYQAAKADVFIEEDTSYAQTLQERYSIERNTAIIVDKSVSMVDSIEIAKRQGRNIAVMCGGKTPVVFHDEAASVVIGDPEDWESVFRGVRVDGNTALGAPFDALLNYFDVEDLPDQIVFITDQDERTLRHSMKIDRVLPMYVDALYPRYLNVVVIHVGRGNFSCVETACNRNDVECTVIRWSGDYTAEENLYNLLSGRSVSRYDIVDEIMATPLPVRRE